MRMLSHISSNIGWLLFYLSQDFPSRKFILIGDTGELDPEV